MGFCIFFYDDYQQLHTSKIQYPIHTAPFELTQNVRNSGNIFHLVQAVYPNRVEVDSALAEQGLVEFWEFSSEERTEHAVMNQAISKALEAVEIQNLVVLTTEFLATESTLHNLSIEVAPDSRWQEGVNEALEKMVRRLLSSRVDLPQLSHAPHPTQDDIQRIQDFARYAAVNSKQTQKQWDDVQKGLHQLQWLTHSDGRVTVAQNYGGRALSLLFQKDNWADGIPRPARLKIVAGSEAKNFDIRLYTIPSFKGLEADGVILFIHPATQGGIDALKRNMYVGLSRAKLLLYMVCDHKLTGRIPYGVAQYFGR